MKAFVFLNPTEENLASEINSGAHAFPLPDKLEERLETVRNEHQERVGRLELASLLNHTEREYHTEEFNQKVIKFKDLYKEKLNACIDERYRKKGFKVHYVGTVSDLLIVGKEDVILNGNVDLDGVKELRVGGFRLWEEVSAFARTAHAKGISTLIDEDLTELFKKRLFAETFKTDTYPTHDPRKDGEKFFELYMRSRRDKPWMWQEY